jgi:flagellar motor switch protein FliM
VTGNLTPAEQHELAQAFRAAEPIDFGTHVELRQFERPMRLSSKDFALIRERLREPLEQIAADFEAALRSPAPLDLIELAEVNAESVSAALPKDFAALRFEVEGQVGWLVLECAAVISAMEVLLGADAANTAKARRFTSIEASMLTRWLEPAVTKIAAALGLKAGKFTVAQDIELLGHWRQAGEKAEIQRLCATFAFQGPPTPSTWRLYLPSVQHAKSAAVRPAPQAPLPAQLSEVEVQLHAELGSVEIPLASLLQLEVGDLVTIRKRAGEPLFAFVEGQPCFVVEYGQHQGRLAVRVAANVGKRPPAR